MELIFELLILAKQIANLPGANADIAGGNIRIRIDDGVDASTRISFTLRPETLDETLRIIENLTHFACERTDRQHITIRKR